MYGRLNVDNAPTVRIRMDTSKAMALLGFSTSRMLEETTLGEIQTAFMFKVHSIEMVPTHDSQGKKSKRDELRRVNEAYQFLRKKQRAFTGRSMEENWQMAGGKSKVVRILNLKKVAEEDKTKSGDSGGSSGDSGGGSREARGKTKSTESPFRARKKSKDSDKRQSTKEKEQADEDPKDVQFQDDLATTTGAEAQAEPEAETALAAESETAPEAAPEDGTATAPEAVAGTETQSQEEAKTEGEKEAAASLAEEGPDKGGDGNVDRNGEVVVGAEADDDRSVASMSSCSLPEVDGASDSDHQDSPLPTPSSLPLPPEPLGEEEKDSEQFSPGGAEAVGNKDTAVGSTSANANATSSISDSRQVGHATSTAPAATASAATSKTVTSGAISKAFVNTVWEKAALDSASAMSAFSGQRRSKGVAGSTMASAATTMESTAKKTLRTKSKKPKSPQGKVSTKSLVNGHVSKNSPSSVESAKESAKKGARDSSRHQKKPSRTGPKVTSASKGKDHSPTPTGIASARKPHHHHSTSTSTSASVSVAHIKTVPTTFSRMSALSSSVNQLHKSPTTYDLTGAFSKVSWSATTSGVGGAPKIISLSSDHRKRPRRGSSRRPEGRKSETAAVTMAGAGDDKSRLGALAPDSSSSAELRKAFSNLDLAQMMSATAAATATMAMTEGKTARKKHKSGVKEPSALLAAAKSAESIYSK